MGIILCHPEPGYGQSLIGYSARWRDTSNNPRKQNRKTESDLAKDVENTRLHTHAHGIHIEHWQVGRIETPGCSLAVCRAAAIHLQCYLAGGSIGGASTRQMNMSATVPKACELLCIT